MKGDVADLEEGDVLPPEEVQPRREMRFIKTVGVVLWTSFLAAAVEAMFFFAYVDPMLLFSRDLPQFWFESRMTSYSVGFLFFWSFSMVASALCVSLMDRTAR
jgi:hypothetical protein